MHHYDENFYRYIQQGALASAELMLPLVLVRTTGVVNSVLDVGCGAGAWLSVWKKHGSSIHGLDGDYVNRDKLLIEQQEFEALDITQGFSLGRKFDLVQSMEVAEHLPPAAAATFVNNLCEHADMVLFSAAPPGQGGENHINEQPYGYWRDLFAQQGFAIYDAIRGELLDKREVEPWYRYNTFLYVRQSAHLELHESLRQYAVPANTQPADVSPILYQWRKKALSLLSAEAKTKLAILKKWANNTFRKT